MGRRLRDERHIRGDALSGKDSTRIVRTDGDANRKLKIDQPFVQNIANAVDFADFLISQLDTAKYFPRVYLEDRTDYQFLDLFDKVNLTVSTKGISGNYDVGGIEHSFMSPTGKAVRTKLYLEPSLDDHFWVFTTKVGQSSIFGF